MSAALQPELKAPAAKRKRRPKQRRKSGPRGINYTDLLTGGPTKVAISTGKAVRHAWNDPDDHDVGKRTARVIEGYQAFDNLVFLYEKGSIGKTHMRVGQRLRKAFELSEFGISKSNIAALGMVHNTGTPDGPSEMRLLNIERFTAVREALGRLMDVLDAIVCRGLSIREYADKYSLNRAAVSARLIAALDVLASYYERLDGPAKAASRGSS